MPIFKPYADINFGERDSHEYLGSERKELFEKLFLRDEKMDKILESNKYFILGDKGTGKTAYPVYLQNHSGQNIGTNKKRFARVVNMKDTDYLRFMRLKVHSNLNNSDYCDVWKLILLMLFASSLKENEDKTIFNSKKFAAIDNVIEDYYLSAYTPEIAASMQFVEGYQENVSALLKAQTGEVGAGFSNSRQRSTDNVRIQIAIPFLIRQFIDSFNELKPKNEHLIFIDGIDIRPADVPFNEYMECIKGLVEAVYSLNSDTFQNNKNMRVCRALACVRTDIFFSLDLHNMNAKLHDNSVIMDWQVSYSEYRGSSLFRLADRLFRGQQDCPNDFTEGECWDYYFPYKLDNRYKDDSFIDFLKSSFYRPRDILEYLRILKARNADNGKTVFSSGDFSNRGVTSDYSDYLLGEIKDAMEIYGNSLEFDSLRSYFNSLKEIIRGKYWDVKYKDFVKAFEIHTSNLTAQKLPIPHIFENGIDNFMQLLFKLNIVGYIDYTPRGMELRRWYFKERSSTNIQPQIKTNDKTIYQMHRGIAKALKLID